MPCSAYDDAILQLLLALPSGPMTDATTETALPSTTAPAPATDADAAAVSFEAETNLCCLPCIMTDDDGYATDDIPDVLGQDPHQKTSDEESDEDDDDDTGANAKSDTLLPAPVYPLDALIRALCPNDVAPNDSPDDDDAYLVDSADDLSFYTQAWNEIKAKPYDNDALDEPDTFDETDPHGTWEIPPHLLPRLTRLQTSTNPQIW